MQCAVCSKSDEEVYRLLKCPTCYRQVCEGCAVKFNGRYFCSNQCARNYFFSYDDD